MKQFLDRFILSFPVLFLKQYPYAWIAAVVLWPRAPWLAAIFLALIVAAIVALRWQNAAWISSIRRQYAGEGGKFHIDEPPIAWRNTFQNVAILTGFSVVLAYLLDGQFGLTFWQYLLMSIGFTTFYRDGRFFGPRATYIVTAAGIGIRLIPGQIDYRLFLPFKEISRIERREYRKSQDVDIFARTQEAKDGLLLVPKDPHGFSKRIDKLFIVPGNVDAFVEQLPYGYGKTV
jgi:hypothetical protein